jgi:hypothetical protein
MAPPLRRSDIQTPAATPHRQALLTAVWHSVIEHDATFSSYFNPNENPLDQGAPTTVEIQQYEGNWVNFQRRIWRIAGLNQQGETAPKLAEEVDGEGNLIRYSAVKLPERISGFSATNEQDDGPYGRVAAAFAQNGKVDFEKVDYATLPIMLYHELLHVRFRIQTDDHYPKNQRPYPDFLTQWGNPPDPKFQAARAHLALQYGAERVARWLEEKFCIDQAFGKFGAPVFNEEIAVEYAKKERSSNQDELSRLFDLLDQAHGVPIAGRPASVSVKQFVGAFLTKRTEENERLFGAGLEPPPLPADWAKVWAFTHDASKWKAFVRPPLPPALSPQKASAAEVPVRPQGADTANKTPKAVSPGPPPKNVGAPNVGAPDGGATNPPPRPAPPDAGTGLKRPAPPAAPAAPSTPQGSVWRPSPAVGSAPSDAASPGWRPALSASSNGSSVATVSAPNAPPNPFAPGMPGDGDAPDSGGDGIFRADPIDSAPLPTDTTDSTPIATGGGGWDDFLSRGGFGLDQADSEPPSPFGSDLAPPVISAAPAEPPPIDAPIPEPPPEPPVWRAEPPAEASSNFSSPFIPSTTMPYESPFTADLPTPGPPMMGSMEIPTEDD